MNLDDFEKELKRRPLRSVPAEWKRETLASLASDLTTEGTEDTERGEAAGAWWGKIQELLWPSPVAWSALATIWIVIAGLRMATIDTERPKPVAQADYVQLRFAMELKRAVVAEPQTASRVTQSEATKPRSQIRLKASAA
jgi:hypothetical protein